MFVRGGESFGKKSFIWQCVDLVFIISFSALFFYQKNQNSISLATAAELPPILWSKSPSNINKITYSYGNKTINDKTYSGILIGDLRDGLVYDSIIISGSCSVLSTTRLDGKLILKESYTYGANAPQNATEGQIFFEYI